MVSASTAAKAGRLQATTQPKTSGRVVLRPGVAFNGVKVFSASVWFVRNKLGERVTEWLTSRPELSVTEIIVTQSSNAEFHCITITVFYWQSTEDI